MGGVGTVVAEGQEARPAADVDLAAADRRHTVPGPHRLAVRYEATVLVAAINEWL
ncbi:hypothetical protein Sme01_34530 [Sphaerisporangium melleum]|uniref:Uncharacterized protein n=1 Tax=Sphaerisporangium melleum TaxID=321316 RepID=A0A917QYC8_9ACTN|nr:hypothetical protein GCM10007964_17210 [Sphaerisporangium melleum]GII70977.1 hypothetical protein Sme01_34530 [Sphaerisporangium melleum]